ncbi:hypothetical protein INT44_009135, partial [Umbelopsis vinacea]
MSIPSNRQHAPAVSSPLARSSNQSDSAQNASTSSKSPSIVSKRSPTKRKNGKAVAQSAGKSPGKKATPPTAKQKLVKESAEKRLEAQNTSFKWQEALFSRKTVDKATMIEAARYIQPAGYEDVIEERNVEDWCGYPMCSNKRQTMNSKYKISLSERKVFDQTELSTFCSIDCLQRSKFYAAQLSDLPIWSRDVGWVDVEVIEMHENVSEVIAKSKRSLRSSKQNSARLRKAYVENLLSTMAPAPMELKIIEKEPTAIQHINLPDPASPSNSKAGAHDEIEGYRIQFKGKKAVSIDTPEEPTTLILRPQQSEAASIPAIDSMEELDDAAIAENAMKTMMMLKEFKLDELENCQDQLDLMASQEVKEEIPTPTVIVTSSQPPSKKASITSTKKVDQPSTSSGKAPEEYDSNQIITIVVPSEVARKVQQTRKKNAKLAKKSTVPQMTFFGKMWTLMDRMCTKWTRIYIRNLEGHEDDLPAPTDPEQPYYSEDYNLRKHIFSEKVMETYGLIRHQIGLDITIEKDILEVIRTFEMSDSAMGMLDSVELYMVTLILFKAIIDALPETRSLLSSGKRAVQYQACCDTIGV